MAGGSLGTLSIDVLANIANMVSDLGKAQAEAARSSKEIQRSFQEAADSVGDAFKDLAATIGLGFGVEKIAEFTKSVVEAGLQIYDISLKTGISAQTLSSYSVAAQEAGVTVEVFANSLSKMARSANDAAHGEAAQANAFKELGVSVTDAAGHLKSADDLLNEVSIGLDKLQNGLGKTAIVTEIFGRGGATLIPLLSDLGEGVDAARQKAVAFGLAINDAQAKDLKAFDVTITDAGLAIRGEFTQALIQVLPQLQHAADQILEFIQHSQGLKDAVNDGAQAIIFLSDHIEQVTTVVKDLAEIMAARFFLNMAQDALVFGENLLKASTAAVSLKSSMSAVIGTIAAWDIGTAIGNWLNGFNQVKAAAAALVGAAILGWDKMKEGAEIAFAAISTTWTNYVVVPIRSGLASLAESAATFESTVGMQAASAGLQAYAASLRAANADSKSFAEVKAQIVAASDKEYLSDKEVVQSMIDYNESTIKGSAVLKSFGVTTSEVKEATDGFERSSKNARDGLGQLTDLEIKASTALDNLTQGLSGPYAKAWDTFSASVDLGTELIDKATAEYAIGKISIEEYNADIAIGNKLMDESAFKWRDTTDQIKAQHDQFAKLNEDLQLQTQLLGVLPGDQAAVTAGLQAYSAALKANVDLHGDEIAKGEDIHQVLDAQLPAWISAKQAVLDMSDAVKAQNQVLKDWQNIATNAFDGAFQAINKDIIEGGSVMKDLTNIAKQVVEQIIFEFEKLAIINPIMQSIFGASAGNLPTLATGQSALGSLFGDGSGGAAGGSSGLGSLGMAGIGSGLSTLWGGTATGGSSILGSGIGQNFMGPLAEGQSYGYTPSAFGNVIGIAGAAYAGYNEFQNAGGGINGLAGGAAYGLGTLTAAGAIGGIASGAGAAAGAAGSLGAVGLGAIPVVGWVALALMALNMVTGGDVFGTSYKPTGVTGTSVDIGSSGVDVGDWFQEHKHGALFSGGKYKNVDVAASQEQIDAYTGAYKQEQDSITAAAKALGVTAGEAITGSWQVTVDKSGKVIEQYSTVLGQKVTEDAQHFFERVTADNVEALLPASQALDDFFNQFQSNADELADAANMLVSAQIDINKGMGLLGTADTSLADIGNLVQSLSASGESLAQAYARLQTEQLDLQAGLDELGLSSGKTGADFVKFADDAAKAAGGIGNLNSELAALYSAYIPGGQQIANSRAAMQKATDATLSAIGEDTTESMAQFWADFQAAMPTLTPDELQQWIAAGVALANYTKAVTDSAQQYADFQISSYGDAFITSMAGIVEAEKAQIETANELAQAAGLAGASQKDVAAIMRNGSAQLGKALSDLTQGIYSDVSSLNMLMGAASNTTIGLLNSINGGSGGDYARQQQHAQQISTAYDLVQKLGDFSFGTGEDVDKVLKDFGLSPGAIGKVLGENADQVRDQIKAAADTAASMTNLVAIGQEQTDILQDLLDVAQGKTPTIDLSKYLDHKKDGDGTSTKPGVGTGTLPPGDYPSNRIGSPDVVSAVRENTAVQRQQLSTLRNVGRYIPTPRNTRSRRTA